MAFQESQSSNLNKKYNKKTNLLSIRFKKKEIILSRSNLQIQTPKKSSIILLKYKQNLPFLNKYKKIHNNPSKSKKFNPSNP